MYSASISKEQIYATAVQFNELYFNGKIQLNRVKFSYMCSIKNWGYEFEYTDHRKYDYEIQLNTKMLKKHGKLWPRVLCHEMLHVYLDQKGISCKSDCHSGKFKEYAKRINRKVPNMILEAY